MTLGLAFWIIMLVWLVWGVYVNWGPSPDRNAVGGNLMLFILLLLLGWSAFGSPIHG